MSYPHLDTYSRVLRGAHEAAATRQAWPESPRRQGKASWRRSMEAGSNPEGTSAPLVYDLSHIRDIRRSHPLQPLLPLIAQTLSGLAEETGHELIVTDGDGRVLWRQGDHDPTRHAPRADHADRTTDADRPDRPDRSDRARLSGGLPNRLSGGHHWAKHLAEHRPEPRAEHRAGTSGISTGTGTGTGTGIGIGTAPLMGRPVHVCAEEHLLRVLHIWSCSAAPITDPDTGRVIGCVDVSGTAPGPHPATVALVAATAKLAETQLALRMHERDERLRRRYESLRVRPGVLLSPTGRVISGDPSGDLGTRVHLGEHAYGSGQHLVLRDGTSALVEPFADGYLLRPSPSAEPATLSLSFLGEGVPSAAYGDRERPLSLRHAEILALLALHPHGLTAEQLSFHLYGDAGNPVTIRAEIHRLRAQLGDAIAAKPYRLNCPYEADFLRVRRLLPSGDPASLAGAYPGPLLPRSESEEIRRERDELEAQVRACLLRRGAPEDLWAYAQTCNGRDDYEVLERLAALSPTDPRAAAARARLI